MRFVANGAVVSEARTQWQQSVAPLGDMTPPVRISNIGGPEGSTDATVWVASNAAAPRRTKVIEALSRGKTMALAGLPIADAIAYITAFRESCGQPLDPATDTNNS